MLHTATETYNPFKGRLYFFWGKSCIFQKHMWYFARDSGKVHATISMVVRRKYISVYLFLNCVYLKWSFTFWGWRIHYIAFIKGNLLHKVTHKPKNMALHMGCIELDYIHELLNKHLTFWFVGNFLYIVGWKLCGEKCNLFTSGLILFRISKTKCNFVPLTTGPSLVLPCHFFWILVQLSFWSSHNWLESFLFIPKIYHNYFCIEKPRLPRSSMENHRR